MDLTFLLNLIVIIVIVVVIIAVIIFAGRRLNGKKASPPSSETLSSTAPDYQKKPALTRSPEKPKDRKANLKSSGNIFISYRRSDSADIAGRIYDRLIGRYGKNPIFKDVDSIPLVVCSLSNLT